MKKIPRSKAEVRQLVNAAMERTRQGVRLVADPVFWKQVEDDREDNEREFYNRMYAGKKAKNGRPKMPGTDWRVLAHRRADGARLDFSIKPKHKIVFDELATDFMHIEQMNDRQWWCRIGDARLVIDIPKKGQPQVLVERGEYCSCKVPSDKKSFRKLCKHGKAKMGELV